MAIRIPFIADVAAAIRGVRDLGSATDEIVDVLDDVDTSAADAVRALDKVGDESRSLDKVTDSAEETVREVDRMERSFRDAFDSVKKESRSAGDSIDRNVRTATDDASSSTAEFRDEARSNFSEVTSSFTGDMDSIADLAQGTFGGLAGTLTGPLGLAFGGLAVAAGLFYNSWKENAEKTEARISSMYENMLASGADFLDKEYIAEAIKAIYDGADDAIIKVSELRDLATTANIPEPLLARALVGDEAAQAEVRNRISAQRLAISEAIDEAVAKGENITPALTPAIQALQDIEGELDTTNSGLATAQSNAAAASAAIAGIQAPTQGVATSAEDARSKFDGLGRQISSLPNPNVRVGIDSSALDDYLSKERIIHVRLVARPGDPKPV